MAPRFVYMSYPIDQAPIDDVFVAALYDRFEEAKNELLRSGVGIIYDPGDAFRVLLQAEVGPEVRAVNMLALEWADSVLAMLPSNVPSIGVPMEINQAIQDGKPVAVLTDVKSWSLGFGSSENLELFDLDEEGFAKAVIWLSAQPPADLNPPSEKLPFMVVRRPAEVDLTPRKTYPTDAGFDLIVADQVEIPAGAQLDVPMGIAVQLPSWSFGRITGRSSTLRKRGLLVNEGIIDESYRGELFALARNMTEEAIIVFPGERIAQLILHSNVSVSVQPSQVQDLSITARGNRGFGSTGV